jgi:uncharacterized RDD family membrane protein YckC
MLEQQFCGEFWNHQSEKRDMHVNLDEVRYAGFWARFFASLLDSIIQLLLIVPLLFMLFGRAAFTNPELDMGWTGNFVQLLSVIWVILFWKFKSATPGKIMMGMSVVDATTGDTPRTLKLILRYFAYIISILPCLLGFFWIGWDKRKQGFHDKIANTVVVMNPRDNAEA